MGAPDVLERAGALSLAAGPRSAALEQRDRERAGASSPSASRPRRCPPTPPGAPPPRLTPLALVVLEETLRPDAAETIAFMREQEVDLKLISGDARSTVTAVAGAVGVPADAGTIEGPDLPDGPGGPGRGARARTRSSAGSRPSRRRRWSRRCANRGATRR